MSFDCFKYLFGFKEIMDDYKKQEAPYTTTTPTPSITTTPMNNTIQTTSSWLETIWNLIFTIICSFWDNRLILLRDLIIFEFAIITLYYIYQSYKNQSSTFSNTNTNNNSANASLNQPTTFKNTIKLTSGIQLNQRNGIPVQADASHSTIISSFFKHNIFIFPLFLLPIFNFQSPLIL